MAETVDADFCLAINTFLFEAWGQKKKNTNLEEPVNNCKGATNSLTLLLEDRHLTEKLQKSTTASRDSSPRQFLLGVRKRKKPCFQGKTQSVRTTRSQTLTNEEEEHLMHIYAHRALVTPRQIFILDHCWNCENLRSHHDVFLLAADSFTVDFELNKSTLTACEFETTDGG